MHWPDDQDTQLLPWSYSLTGGETSLDFILFVWEKDHDQSFVLWIFAIKSSDSADGLWTSLAQPKIGLKLLYLRKFSPNIIGEDRLLNTTAEPENIVDKLLNLILTSTWPTVSIVKFELCPICRVKIWRFNFTEVPTQFI